MQQLLDLNTVIAQFARRVRPVGGDRAVLRTQLDPNIGLIAADAKLIDWLLVNLAADVYDAMPGGGELVVSTASVELDEATAAEMSIHPGTYARMEFAAPIGGRDAGATVRNLVQQLGGAVSVRAVCGSGVVIDIFLPQAEEPSAVRTNQTPVILVVSDDSVARQLTRDLLTDAGYEVIEAVHGKEAEAVLAAREVDVMITDVVLPEKDGLETILTVRAVHPRLKIIAVGDKPGGYQVRTARLLGADAVVAKPLTGSLREVVQRQIGGSQKE